MLVLSRKLHESIIINGNIEITVERIRGNSVRLGFKAPADVTITRGELLQQSPEEHDANSNAGATRPD